MQRYQQQQPFITEVNLDGLLPESIVDVPSFLKLRVDPNDNTLIFQTSTALLANAPNKLASIRQFLQLGDYLSLKQSAHKEKGSASTLGFYRLANAYLRLEYASYLVIIQQIVPDAQQFSALYYSIEREYAMLRECLRTIFSGGHSQGAAAAGSNSGSSSNSSNGGVVAQSAGQV